MATRYVRRAISSASVTAPVPAQGGRTASPLPAANR
jgi:hypothetical protein